MYLKTGFKGML